MPEIKLLSRQVLILGVVELVRVRRFLKSHDFSYPQIENGQGTTDASGSLSGLLDRFFFGIHFRIGGVRFTGRFLELALGF